MDGENENRKSDDRLLSMLDILLDINFPQM